MTEEEKEVYKIKIPLLTEQEILTIDNYCNEIVNKFTEQVIHDKELAIAQHIIQKQQAEIEKLKEIDLRQDKLVANMSNRHFHDREKIRRKDKIIYEMTKAMDNIKDVQVCEYCNNNNGYCKDERKCRQGIKQYFEKKVEDE